jgi:preprotein translocase subunit SecD
MIEPGDPRTNGERARAPDPGHWIANTALGRTLVGVGAVLLVFVITVTISSLRDEPVVGGVRSTLQVRRVLRAVDPDDPSWSDLTPTCARSDPCPPGAAPADQTIVLEDAAGTRFRLAPAVLTQADVAEARPVEASGWEVTVRLRPEGTEVLATETARVAGRPPPRNRLAIVVDGHLRSAPTVAETISSGTLVIGAHLGEDEAVRLATGLSP